MTKWKEGRSALVVRLEEEVIQALREEAERTYGPPVRGSSGGASRLVRSWIYQKLGREAPPEWGDKNPTLNAKRRADKSK